MRMLALALAKPPANPSPAMPYAQPNYPPQYNSYGRFNTSLPVTHEASYENRDAFPASHYQRIASGQESSSPCATGPILSASQTLYEGDNNGSYNF